MKLTTYHILFLDTPQLFHNSSMDSESLTAGEFWAWQQTDCVKIASVSNCYQHLAQTFSISPHSGNSVFPTRRYLGLRSRCFGWAACVMNCVLHSGQSLKQNSGGFGWIGLQFINCGEMLPGLLLVLRESLRPLIGRGWHPIPLKGLRPQLSAIRHHRVPRSCCWVSHFISVTTLLLQWCAEWQDASGDNPFKLRLCLKLRLNPTREEKVFCLRPSLLCLIPINNEICVKLKSIHDNKQQTSLVCQLIYYCIITKLIGTNNIYIFLLLKYIIMLEVCI